MMTMAMTFHSINVSFCFYGALCIRCEFECELEKRTIDNRLIFKCIEWNVLSHKQKFNSIIVIQTHTHTHTFVKSFRFIKRLNGKRFKLANHNKAQGIKRMRTIHIKRKFINILKWHYVFMENVACKHVATIANAVFVAVV